MKTTTLAALALAAALPSAEAAIISLFESGLNIDGTSSFFPGDPLPPGVDVSAFDPLTGLGTVSVTVTGAGNHFVGAYVDLEIDEAINTFFNESGLAIGAPAAGQSWEIDEPGFTFGNIITNFTAGTLDNSITPFGPEDVSMALGWNFLLNAGETANINFTVSPDAPAGGFYLRQGDLQSRAEVFYYSNLTITGQPPHSVPDGGCTLPLLLLGLAGLGAAVKQAASRRPL